MSLSARRAWIEIRQLIRHLSGHPVALRKESVDRNKTLPRRLVGGIESLSARRAWIEMKHPQNKLIAVFNVALRKESVDRNNVGANYHVRIRQVALRKESVDRNDKSKRSKTEKRSRSPQGERG